MKKGLYLVVAFLILVSVFFPNQKIFANSPGEEREFLVKSRNMEETKSFLNNISIKIESTIKELGILKITATPEKADKIASNPSTLFIEENKETRLSYIVPNDPLFSYQKYLTSSNILSAWDITQGDGSIIVSVIDSGVNYNHEDLRNVMWTNSKGEHGYDFVSLDNDPMDDYFHGTMVAGIIGAEANNGKGIAGSAKVKIMAVRAIGARSADDPPDMGEVADLVEGIIYSVNNGAKVINISLGTPDNSSTLDEAISFATSNGCIIVAAVGNAYDDEPARNVIDNPARNPSVIGVSALNNQNQKPSYANYGSGISITALGNGIYSTGWDSEDPNTSYYAGDGTSFSAPQATAAAALILSNDPSLSPAQVKKRLIVSAQKINGMSGYSQYYGYGKLDAYSALTYDKLPPAINVNLYNNGDGSYLMSGDIKDDLFSPANVMGNVPNSNIREVKYTIDNNVNSWKVINEAPVQSFKVNFDTNILGPENHTITISAEDTEGNIQTAILETKNALTIPTSDSVADYGALLINQSPYVTLSPNQTKTMNLAFKNTGNSAWDKQKVRLATTRTMDRASAFSDSSWASNNRIYMQESYVAPGNIAHFDFTVTAPPGLDGIYREYFNIVIDGVGWMRDMGIYWNITVEMPSYHAEYIDQSPYLTLERGEEASVWVDYKNAGSISWDSGNVRLGTNSPIDRQSIFYNNATDSGWFSSGRIKLEQQTVDPGEVGRFSFTIKAPNQTNNYTEYFRPVADGVTWMEDYGLYWNIEVK